MLPVQHFLFSNSIAAVAGYVKYKQEVNGHCTPLLSSAVRGINLPRSCATVSKTVRPQLGICHDQCDGAFRKEFRIFASYFFALSSCVGTCACLSVSS